MPNSIDPTLATVDVLRRLFRDAHPDLSEHINWNAPSFALVGHDRITLESHRTGGASVVLHRGAKQQKVGLQVHRSYVTGSALTADGGFNA